MLLLNFILQTGMEVVREDSPGCVTWQQSASLWKLPLVMGRFDLWRWFGSLHLLQQAAKCDMKINMYMSKALAFKFYF